MTNILRKGERVKLPAIFFLTICVTLFVSGCKKEESDLGLDVQPEEDLLNALVVDTFSIYPHTILEDSLRTDELVSGLILGNYHHNDVGSLEASIYTQLNFTSTSGFGTSPMVDSVVLQLVTTDVYGQQTEQQFEVYEVTQDFYDTSKYYSNSVLNYNLNNAAPTTVNYFKPNVSDSIMVDGVKVRPHIRMHLAPWFGQYLLGFEGVCMTTFANNFRYCFKGLYIKSSSTFSGNNGAIYNIDLTDAQSKIRIYYHNTTDTTYYDFVFGSSVARFSHIETDHTGTPAAAQLADSTLGNMFYYLQGGAGLGAKLYIPHIRNLGLGQNVVVNKAELVLPFQYYSIDPYSPAYRIFVFPYTADGKIELTLDQFVDPSLTTYGGLYDNVKKAYVFNLSRHIQKIVKGEKENYGFRLAVGASSVSANRVVLSGPNSPNRAKPYLKITYTKYQ